MLQGDDYTAIYDCMNRENMCALYSLRYTIMMLPYDIKAYHRTISANFKLYKLAETLP